MIGSLIKEIKELKSSDFCLSAIFLWIGIVLLLLLGGIGNDGNEQIFFKFWKGSSCFDDEGGGRNSAKKSKEGFWFFCSKFIVVVVVENISKLIEGSFFENGKLLEKSEDWDDGVINVDIGCFKGCEAKFLDKKLSFDKLKVFSA